MRGSLAALALALAVMVGADAKAQSLRDARALEAEENALAREVAFTNSVCGSSMSARLEWSANAQWPEVTGLADACGGALSAIEAACRSDENGSLSSLREFRCVGDGAGPSLRGQIFRYGAARGVNAFEETRRYLDDR